MDLYARMIYEDGTCTPMAKVEVDQTFDGGPGVVTIQSTDNGIVTRVEVREEDGRIVAISSVNLFVRVVDQVQLTVIPPAEGWPAADITKTSIFFAKEIDDEAEAMRKRLMVMRDKLRYRQDQIWLKDQQKQCQWVARGYKDVQTGDYL